MIYKEMTREQMLSELICDTEYLYDILDVEFVVDALIDQSKGEYMIWDRLGIWNMYCEMRKQVHEESKAKGLH